MGWSEGQDIGNLIESSEKLTSIFGYWPSFHDAEVLEVNLWRGDVDPKRNAYVFPTLTAKIHVWELTNDVNAQGYYARRHHTLTKLRFHDVSGLHMSGFNHQNAIFGLAIVREERSEGPSPVFSVQFEEAHGIKSEFICMRVEVLEANECDEDGRVITA